MTRSGRIPAILAAALLLVSNAGEKDADNPTCPKDPNWGPASPMKLTAVERDGKRVLLAEGVIDPVLPDRLYDVLAADETIEEVWVRSRGGDARAGNEAGKVIRELFLPTRIPSGWTCFSACNFVFMGGISREIDPGGIFMVHMFTHTGQREVIAESVDKGTEDTVELIGEIEQLSALLASEDNDFLIRMGLSRKLLTDIMYRQLATGGKGGDGERYCLSPAEALKYNVVNPPQD